jgi:hypothetical protein
MRSFAPESEVFIVSSYPAAVETGSGIPAASPGLQKF